MSIHESVPIMSSGSITLLQCPPDNIPIYWVQETELLMVAKGGDALAQRVAFASAGALVGALPGAIAALSQYWKDGKIDAPNLVALVIACAGLLLTGFCGWIDQHQKTYPERLLKEILARKNARPQNERDGFAHP